MHPKIITMALLFEHKKTFKKYLCRIIFVTTIIILCYLFANNKSDYAIFISIFFLLLLIPSITELKVYQNRVEVIVHYGLLAMTSKRHVLRSENMMSISPVEIEIESDAEAYLLFDSILRDILIFIYPIKTIIKSYRIKYSEFGEDKEVDVPLTDEDYKTITSILT